MVQCPKLLFSLPFSSGSIERMFSSLKLVKTDRLTNLHTTTLDDLLDISIEGPDLKDFSPDQAIEAWWKGWATTRRVNQTTRKEYRCHAQSSSSVSVDTDDTDEPLCLT